MNELANFISSTYRILEQVFNDLNYELLKISVKRQDNYMELLKTRLDLIQEKFNCSFKGEQLEALTTSKFLPMALKGQTATLNGYFSAFLILLDQDQLDEYLDFCSSYKFDLVSFILEILKLRGHNSQQKNSIPNQKIKEYFSNLLFLIKSITETFK